MRDPQIPFSIQIDGQTFFRDDDTAWSEEDVGWLADCFHLRMEDSQRDDRARWDAAQARAERLVEFLMAMERLGVQVTELTFRTPPPPPPGPSVFRIGVSLVPFVINLIVMGWAVGIFTTAVILRFGQEAEVLAWGLAFLFQPVSAVFYPVSVLPPVLQVIAHGIPAAHVFEGMRAVIEGKAFPLSGLVWAASLNVVYLVGTILFFNWMFRIVKMKGLLVRVGE